MSTPMTAQKTCTRFAPYASSLDKPIHHPSFAAHWIVHGSLTHPNTPPSSSDITLLYLHGGGYVIGNTGIAADMLLLLAQELESRAPGLRVSVVSLDYSLAPEAPFPAQIAETAACYEWLVKEMGVPASKIAVGGDSAGGSLALGFLMHLNAPIQGVAAQCKGLGKPGLGAFLWSPWVDLMCTGTTYDSNANLDLLTTHGLKPWAAMLFERSAYGFESAEADRYVHLLSKRAQGADWKSILPTSTYVTTGSAELFFSDISKFVEQVRAAGAEVQFDVGVDKIHVFQQFDFQGVSKTWQGGGSAGEAGKAFDLPISMLLKGVGRGG